MHGGQNDVSSRFTRAALMSHNKSVSLIVVVLYDGHSISDSEGNARRARSHSRYCAKPTPRSRATLEKG